MAQTVTNTPHEDRFINNMRILIDKVHKFSTIAEKNKIHTISPKEVRLAEGYLLKKGGNALLENFIAYSHRYWGKIFDKSESFFKEESNAIFGNIAGIGETEIDLFSKLLYIEVKGQPIVSPQDRVDIWLIFKGFVKQSLAYLRDRKLCPERKFRLREVECELDLPAELMKWEVKPPVISSS
jgi:hypothetical protein